MRQAPQKIQLPFLRRRAEKEAGGFPALMARAEKAAQSVLSGEHAQRRPGAGEKFWQFREYDPSDRPQDIDWRQSAKTDRVFVRQKERQTMQTALFWCAGGAGMDYSSAQELPSKRDDAMTAALALAILMRRAGEQVGLLNGAMIPGRSDAALQLIGQDMIDRHETALPPAAQIPLNAAAVLCGDFLSPPEEIETAFAPLAARAGTGIVVQVLDPAELSLPFAGRVIFEESAGTEKHHIFHVESIRAAYRNRIDSHLAAVKGLCRKYGWHWVLHTTDKPVRNTLADIWGMINSEFSTGAPR